MKMIPWGGVSCCLSAAALYLLGRSSGRDAEILKSVTRVNQLKELENDQLPMCLMSVVGGTARFSERQRKLFYQHFFPWAFGLACNALILCVCIMSNTSMKI